MRPCSLVTASLVGLAALAGLAAPPPAAGAIVEVTDCGDTTPGGGPGQIRTLLSAALFPTTIVVPACTITLTGAAGDDANLGGDLDLVGFKTVTIQGAGVGRTVLDGGGLDRVIHVVGNVTLTLADLTVRAGVAVFGGGGIKAEASADLILRRVEVTGNTTTGAPSSGGGIQALGDELSLDQTTVSGNTAPGGLGGGVAASVDRLTVERSTISGNTALAGGGLALFGPNLQARITQSTVSGNRATGPLASGEGGGLWVDTNEPKWVLYTTIVGNTSDNATTGGIFNKSAPGVSLRASIVAANGPADCGGPGGIISAGHNLQGDGSCALAAAGDLTAPDPGLGPLAANGGPTATHGLRPGSRAIDRGGETGCPSVDQRGVRRPQDGDGDGEARCDTGAVERRDPGAARPE